MDLGLDWNSVATSVVVGLILAVVIGSFRWYLRRRERRAKEAEARAINRAHLRAGASQVAQELRANAEVAKRCEDGYHVSAEAKFVSLIQWKDFKGQIAGLQAEAPELWQELEETYEALGQTKTRGANPPHRRIS